MAKLAISRLHHPVTVLGHGVRAGVWVQGCTLACPGCMSRDTWEPRPDTEADVEAVLAWTRRLPGPLDGVTVSGGEPFQQPGPLAELLHGLRELPTDDGGTRDLLVFSGYAWPRLRDGASYGPALTLCDAVVAGPYVARRNTGSPLRGSDNQQVVPLTPLGRERYGPEALDRYGQRRLQVTADGGDLRVIGIPRRADLARWQAASEAGGVTWEGTTWTA
ncbi:4Fe-4S single cluster domain-containing protein [Streptomyces ortus]|uniref:Radical SAM protein n=1 Tax=Streptomyces ortus TaxID=2867268 RepID=A0ABT3VBG1_9ACTN|nr:4Fe-4S single cluster domain-containing protein [Streptomyces ortus]MCX4237279.1 radical SAM protein [Streptomyces ortus]